MYTFLRAGLTAAAVLVSLCCPRGAPASAWTEGKKSLLYIRIDFPDLPGDPIPAAELKATLANAHKYFRENSYGQLIITPSFTPTMRVPHPLKFYESNPDTEKIIRDARDAARRAGFDTRDYTLDIVAFKTGHGGGSELAAIGAKGARIVDNFRLGITLHALGHNLGLPHSSFWKTSDGTIFGEGISEEYGDPYDPMGGGGGHEESMRNHLVVRSKAICGWLDKVGLTSVTRSGKYRLFAEDLPGGGCRALRIDRDAASEYWVEFRQLIKEDPRMMNGVRILRGYKDRNAVDWLSMNPDSPDSKGDAPLALGQTFSDADAGIHVTPVAINHNTQPPSVDVVVELTKAPPGPAIALHVSAVGNPSKPGEPMELSAVADNPGGAALLYSWDFGDGTCEAGSQKVTHAWTTGDRDYVVRAFVTDMKGRTAASMTTVTIGRPVKGKFVGTVAADGKPLAGVRVNAASQSAVTDDEGRFAQVGLADGSHLLRPTKRGYFILPVMQTSPDPKPLEFRATKLPAVAAPGAATLHIHATIDGSDELRITRDRATWQHKSYDWPTNVTLNDVAMDPHSALRNAGKSAFLKGGMKAASAVVTKQTGRGAIDVYRQGDSLVIVFDDDAQPGAADYDLEIALEPG